MNLAPGLADVDVRKLILAFREAGGATDPEAAWTKACAALPHLTPEALDAWKPYVLAHFRSPPLHHEPRPNGLKP